MITKKSYRRISKQIAANRFPLPLHIYFGSDSMTYNFCLCQMLERNIADEAEVREGYYNLFDCYNDDFSEREREQLRKIIAEEIKHTEILEAMIYRRNGIVGEH